MDRWIRRFRSARTVEGQEKVIIPGDPEREIEAVRRKEGIPLPPSVWEDLQRTGSAFGIPL
jgi:LDH2 family malate/lactate/ureidoglycolate dehydrogenase